MTSDDTLVAMLALAASSRNPLFQKGKWRFVTACAARDDASRYFSEDPFRILGLRFCRCVKKEQNRRRGPLTLTELPDCCGRGNRGEERSTEIKTEILKRVGVSSLWRRQRQFVSPLRIHRDHRFASTFSKFRGKSGASGAHKKNDPHYLSESKCKQATAFQD